MLPLKTQPSLCLQKLSGVKTTYTNGLQQRPLQPENRFFANAEYNTVTEEGKGWRFDATYHFVGSQRLPENPKRWTCCDVAGAYGLMERTN